MDKSKQKEILSKVATLLSRQLTKKVEDITPEKRIVEDLGADSLDVVELLCELEEVYGVSIPDDEAMKLKTVGDLVNYLDKNKAK